MDKEIMKKMMESIDTRVYLMELDVKATRDILSEAEDRLNKIEGMLERLRKDGTMSELETGLKQIKKLLEMLRQECEKDADDHNS